MEATMIYNSIYLKAGTDNEVAMMGYTKHIIGDCEQGGCAMLIKPDTDYDSSFKAFDTDSQEWITVHSWLWTFEDAA